MPGEKAQLVGDGDQRGVVQVLLVAAQPGVGARGKGGGGVQLDLGRGERVLPGLVPDGGKDDRGLAPRLGLQVLGRAGDLPERDVHGLAVKDETALRAEDVLRGDQRPVAAAVPAAGVQAVGVHVERRAGDVLVQRLAADGVEMGDRVVAELDEIGPMGVLLRGDLADVHPVPLAKEPLAIGAIAGADVKAGTVQENAVDGILGAHLFDQPGDPGEVAGVDAGRGALAAIHAGERLAIDLALHPLGPLLDEGLVGPVDVDIDKDLDPQLVGLGEVFLQHVARDGAGLVGLEEKDAVLPIPGDAVLHVLGVIVLGLDIAGKGDQVHGGQLVSRKAEAGMQDAQLLLVPGHGHGTPFGRR